MAMTVTQDHLLVLAQRFRRAIEATDSALLPVTFSRFPAAACGDASDLLGQYLIDNGIGPVEYVCGVLAFKSHAWVRVDGVIIDITADQFDDVDTPVIVTAHSPWHDRYRIERVQAGGVDVYDEHTRFVLRGAYDVVLANLPTAL